LQNLAMAGALTTAAWLIATPTMLGAPGGLWHGIGAIVYPLATWTSTFAVIGLALQFLSGFSPTRRYIADASYWIYLIHLPIVMALQVLLAPLDWPWPVKFAVLLGVGLAVMFASYQLLVRHSVIGAVLNGPRPRRARLPTERPSSTPAASLSESPR
jgi:peptidoglycan/LPS O-acetylase OafA/YrhL